MAAYLTSEIKAGDADAVIIALPGDIVGASPPGQGLLLYEPTMLFFNTYANPFCTLWPDPPDPPCNMVAIPGNHEFDKGLPELMRKIQ